MAVSSEDHPTRRAREAPSVAPASRADAVYEQLKQEIADFRLVPGDRFTENELSERLAVSRTPIRQALYRLQQEGQVEVMFRSGWRVLPLDFEKFEHLYDLRMVLETAAVQRLCGGDLRVDRPALAELCEVWLVPASARRADMAEVGRMDEQFHCSLVRMAGNPEITRVHHDITERIRIIRRLDFTKSARIDSTYEEHGNILRAIRSGRAEMATSLLRTHISNSQTEVRKITLHQLFLARTVKGQG